MNSNANQNFDGGFTFSLKQTHSYENQWLGFDRARPSYQAIICPDFYSFIEESKQLPTSLQSVKSLPALPSANNIQVAEAQEFINGFIEKTSQHSFPSGSISGAAGGTEDVIADISFLGRTTASLVGPDSAVYQAIGVTTGENVFMGFFAAFKAWNRFKEASRISDFGGTVEGGLDTARGVTQGIGGGFYLGYRGAMIASEINNVNTTISATTALGKATFYTGLVGNFFFTLFYMFLGLWGGYHLYQTGKFLYEMKKTEDVVPFLISQVHADTHVKLKKLQTESDERKAAYKQKLREKTLTVFSDQFQAWQSQMIKDKNFDGKKLSCSEIKSVIEALFEAIENNQEAKQAYLNEYCSQLGITRKEVDFLDLSSMQICGLKLEERDRQSRKEMKAQRALGGQAFEKIKKAYETGLLERLEATDLAVKAAALSEAEGLKSDVSSALIKNLFIYGAFVLIGVLGAVVTVATIGLFALPPGLALVMTILTFVLAFTMIGIDGYFLKTGLESGAPAQHDKLFVAVITVVMVLSMGLAAGLTFGFALPLLPFIFAMIIGGAALCLAGYVLFHKLPQREKKWNEDHPDLEVLEKALLETEPNSELDERTEQLFKKLSKADRNDIKIGYFTPGEHQNFKTQEFKDLNKEHNFGHLYIDKVISLENPQNEEYQILERAAKKVSKAYWRKWHFERQEKDRQNALKMHTFIQLLKAKRGDVLNLSLKHIQEDKDLYQALKANVYYLCKRKESAQDLKSVIGIVRKMRHMQPESFFTKERMQRAQELYTPST